MNAETASPLLSAVRVSDLVSADVFLVDLHCDSKEDVLRAIADRMARLHPPLSMQHIFDVLWEREALGSTGIESGIAVPHGRIKAISAPVLVVAKTAAPVKFGAIDEMPTDLFFAVLAPVSCNDHLKVLSQLARMFQLPDYASHLRYCRTPEEMLSCFQSWEAALTC